MQKRVGVNLEFFPRCNGDCAFCAWGQALKNEKAPQLWPREAPLDWKRFEAELKYAKTEKADLEIMSDSEWWKKERFHNRLLGLLELAEKEYPQVRIWLQLGIIDNPEIFEDFHQYSVYGYTSNIETSPEHFSQICRTHTFDDKIQSLKLAKTTGLKISSGVCLNIGQTESDLHSAIDVLRQLGIDWLVLNIFYRIDGLELTRKVPPASPEETMRSIKWFRNEFPSTPIILGGGRCTLEGLEREALSIVEGVYIRRFLNFKFPQS